MREIVNKKGRKMKEENNIQDKTNNKKTKKEYILLVTIILGIIIIDQILKIIVITKGEIQIIPKLLKFSLTENTSPAYGIGSNSTIMYVITNVVILSVIFKFVTNQNQYVDTKFKIFLSFIFAGGISNINDKVFRGYVVEFFDFSQFIKFPIFNLADIFTIIGWVCIAGIFAKFTVKEWRNSKK